MEYHEGSLGGAGGLPLFYRFWQREEPSCAVLVRVQGVGGHSGMYQPFVEAVVAHGYAVYGLDLRGHGRSAGRRGHIDRWSEYREDLRRFLVLVVAADPGRPMFLMGFSGGGLLVLDYALDHPVGLSGVVALSPALDVGIPASKRWLARLLSRLWPTYAADTSLDRTNVSRDTEAARRLLADPLAFHAATARYATEVFAAQHRVQARAAGLAVPLLILHGTADRQAPPAASRRFFDQVPIADKVYRLYPGAYHALDWETNREEVFADCIAWLDRHVPAETHQDQTPVLAAAAPGGR